MTSIRMLERTQPFESMLTIYYADVSDFSYLNHYKQMLVQVVHSIEYIYVCICFSLRLLNNIHLPQTLFHSFHNHLTSFFIFIAFLSCQLLYFFFSRYHSDTAIYIGICMLFLLLQPFVLDVAFIPVTLMHRHKNSQSC